MTRGNVFALFFLCIGGLAIAQEIDGFRGHAWGTSKQAVIDAEGPPDSVLEDGDIYYDSTYVGSREARTAFMFDPQDRLAVGEYYFTAYYMVLSDAENKGYLRDFRDLDRRLTDVYGPPDHQEEKWIGQPRDVTDHAIVEGDLQLRTGWQDSEGTILHIIMGPEGGSAFDASGHFIYYFDAEYFSLKDVLDRLEFGGL